MLITSEGVCKRVRPANGQRFTTEEIRAYVGGRFTPHLLACGQRILFINHIARRAASKANSKATTLARELGRFLSDGDYIAGDALLTKNDEIVK